MWKLCFRDSDDFMDLYFTMRYREEINRAIVEEGRIVSALQAIPYPMKYCGHLIETAYISGACTHPDFRKRGAMRRLLRETHRRMHEEGVWLSTLIPAEDWLRGYYARSGYAVCFYYEEDSLSLSLLKGWDAEVEVEICREAEKDTYPCFRRMMWQRSDGILHTQEDYGIILADLRREGGLVFAARRKGEMTGLAFCVKENGMPVVKEMLYDAPEVRDGLCRKILSAYGTERLTYVHAADASASPLGMARVISVRKMLALYAAAHPEETFCCRVEGDEAIPENNGYYALRQGELAEGRLPGEKYERHTIETLTRKFVAAEPLCMSLMLN